MTIARLVAVLVLISLAAGAAAQLRTLPAESKRGKIEHVREMIVAIDGKARRLAPGAQIRGPSNTLLVPMAIPRGALARYTLDSQGQIRQVWILSPQELAKEPPLKTGPASAGQ
ncbi:MAG TPA: hypothetical protein VK043_10050 [Burkholderiales bacterium]|nr:hypothetical protein [Burkholderiales bacterium]